MGPKKGAVKTQAVDADVILDIIARLTKLENWKEKREKQKKARKKEKKKKKEEKEEKKRELQREEEQAQKRAKKEGAVRPSPEPPVATASKHEESEPTKTPTAAKSRAKAKAKAKALPALPAPPSEARPSEAPPAQASQAPPACQLPAQPAVTAAAEKGAQAIKADPDAADKAVPSDPKVAKCCYDTLKIPRTATPEEVKRAYRSLAVKMHPDKGGDHKAFCNLQSAFDVLQDEAERKLYDAELRSTRSRDGTVSLGGEASTSFPVARSAETSPLMLQEALLCADPKDWTALLKQLSDSNLRRLQGFVSLTSKEQDEIARELRSQRPTTQSGKAVPGLVRRQNAYGAKVTFNNISIFSKCGGLDEAIDALIALSEIRSLVRRDPDNFEGALQKAVKLRREIDQDSIFFMRFSCDFKVAKLKFRRATPQRSDVDEMLKDIEVLQKLAEQGASKSQLDDAREAMQQRADQKKAANSHNHAKLRQQLLAEVAREIVHRHSRYNPLALQDGIAKDEAASDPESSSSESESSSSSSS